MTSPDPQKVALAKSIAVNGSQGPAIYKAQQADLGRQSTGALDAASSRAGLINAPEAFLKQQAAMVAEPYSTSSTKAASDSSALGNYLGSMNSAHGDYLSELNAAIPLAQAQVNKAQSGNSVNDLLQILNLKNQMEDRAYTKQQRQTATDTQSKAATDQATQQKALNSILNHSNSSFRDTGIDIINQSKDLPGALAALNSIKDKDLAKTSVNRDELRRTIIQYFDPETFTQLPTPLVSPLAPSSTSTTKNTLPQGTVLGLPADKSQVNQMIHEAYTPGPSYVSGGTAKKKNPWYEFWK